MPVRAKGVEAFTAIMRESDATLAAVVARMTLALAKRADDIGFAVNDAGKTSVRFSIADETPLSFIVNQSDLLFYLRKPTAGRVADLVSLPRVGGEPGERTYRISTLAEADALLDELLPQL